MTLQSGTAHASSTYGTGFEADKAFEGDGYWCSVKNPDTPVRLWFQFKEPKRVVQIKFEEQYKMSGEDGYEVNEIGQQDLHTRTIQISNR